MTVIDIHSTLHVLKRNIMKW